MPDPPLVTICIPTYNSGRWIEESLGSALCQTYAPVEVLVVDDASSDDTVETVRRLGGDRVRVHVNPENLGLALNFNQCIRLARGEYVKFLLADDLLYPHCVARMIALFQQEPSLGFVFSPREILLAEGADARAVEWKRQAGALHESFAHLEEINSGTELFRQYLAGGLRGNWIGEPSCVMVRAACFQRVGLFNPRMWQEVDYALWLRLMCFYDVGFVDEKLSAFRVHGDAATSSNKRVNRDWLDLLWLLEDLLSYDEVRRRYPEIRRLRNRELARVVRAEVGRVVKAPFGIHRPTPPLREKLAGLREYLAHLLGVKRRWPLEES